MKKISVLIPVYGVEKYIERFARSLFSNSIINDCEIIFVNDCTKDSSMEILTEVLKEYQKLSVKIINHEKNKGLAGARNTGLLNATCDYIICLDSDDWIEPDFLEKLYNSAIENDSDIVTCGFYLEKKNGIIKEITQKFYDEYEINYKNLIINKIDGYLWCKMFKRKLFTENNISWVEGINMWEDMLIDSKLFFYARKFSTVNECLYHYSFNSESIVNSKQIENSISILKVIKLIKLFLIDNNFFEICENELKIKTIELKLDFVFRYGINKYYLEHAFTEEELKLMQKKLFYLSKGKIKKMIFLFFYSFKKYKLAKFIFKIREILIKEKIATIDFKAIDYTYFKI